MDEYSFDFFKLQRGAKIAKGYKLEYLGAIGRIGIREHLWKVHITIFFLDIYEVDPILYNTKVIYNVSSSVVYANNTLSGLIASF